MTLISNMEDSSSDAEGGWGSVAASQTLSSQQKSEDLEDEEGWDFALNDSLESSPAPMTPAASVSSAARSNKSWNTTTPRKRGRGRPPGITGSHEFRRMLREEAARSKPASLSKAERCKLAREGKRKKKLSMSSLASSVPISRDIEDIVPVANPVVDASLQQQIFSAASMILRAKAGETCGSLVSTKFSVQEYVDHMFSAKPPPQTLDEENFAGAVHYFFKPYRGYCSMKQTSTEFNTTEHLVSHGLIRSASAVKNLSSSMWNSLLRKVQGMVRDACTHNGILMIAKIRFDETPSKIKVADLDAVGLPAPHVQAGSSKSLAKILQSELEVAFVLQDVSDKSYFMVSGKIPTPLQVLDKQTSKNMRQALEDTLKLDEFEAMSKDFKHRLFLFAADEFSSNNLVHASHPDWLDENFLPM